MSTLEQEAMRRLRFVHGAQAVPHSDDAKDLIDDAEGRAGSRAKTITDVRDFLLCRKNTDGGLTLRPVELDQLLLMLHV